MKLITHTFVIALLLGGCATTNPGSGVGIRYYLPKTIVKAELTLILKSCKNSIDGYAQLDVEPTLTLNVVPSKDGEARDLPGKYLSSARTKRLITVSIHPSGLISGVNSTNQDRTTAIIANAAKIISVAKVVSFTDLKDFTDFEKYGCKTSIIEKLMSINNIRDIIAEKRKLLTNNSYSGSYKSVQEEINALAFEIAKIRSTAPIMLKFSQIIPIDDLKPKDANHQPSEEEDKSIGIDFSAVLKNWLDKSTALDDESDKRFLNELLELTWSGNISDTKSAINAGLDKSENFKACKLSINIPSQTQLTLQIKPKGKLYDKKLDELTKSIPAPQLSKPEELCLSVAFAENRTASMSFNEFGQRISFTWHSEAKGEAVTGALSNIAKDVSSTMSTLEGQSELDKQLEIIKQVNTQIQYNNALLCQQAAAEGATSCQTSDGD